MLCNWSSSISIRQLKIAEAVRHCEKWEFQYFPAAVNPQDTVLLSRSKVYFFLFAWPTGSCLEEKKSVKQKINLVWPDIDLGRMLSCVPSTIAS